MDLEARRRKSRKCLCVAGFIVVDLQGYCEVCQRPRAFGEDSQQARRPRVPGLYSYFLAQRETSLAGLPGIHLLQV